MSIQDIIDLYENYPADRDNFVKDVTKAVNLHTLGEKISSLLEDRENSIEYSTYIKGIINGKGLDLKGDSFVPPLISEGQLYIKIDKDQTVFDALLHHVFGIKDDRYDLSFLDTKTVRSIMEDVYEKYHTLLRCINVPRITPLTDGTNIIKINRSIETLATGYNIKGSKIDDDMVDSLIKYDTVMGGSYVLEKILDKDLGSNDVDFFSRDDRFLVYLCSRFLNKCTMTVTLSNNFDSYKLKLNNGTIYNFILIHEDINKGDMVYYLNDIFDMSCCCAFFDGRMFFYNEDIKKYKATGEANQRRIAKYERRGFDVSEVKVNNSNLMY